MDSRLEQAREYAQWMIDNTPRHHQSKARAAAEVIQSLPDEWIDAEKVREEADRMDKGAENSMKPGHNEFSRGYTEAMQECAEHLRNLLTPPLPTLADLIEQGNDPQQYQWMQADAAGVSTDRVVIISFTNDFVKTLSSSGGQALYDFEDITPLQGEPKMKWPGSGDAPTVAEQENVAPDQQVSPQVNLDSSLPRPEDVPAGEPWIVLYEGVEVTGCRNEPESSLPWLVIRRDEHQFDCCYDTDITLVSRLVPEHKENA